ncbi:MAG: hypothetical protein ABI650_08265 [Dokdonella sp.]
MAAAALPELSMLLSVILLATNGFGLIQFDPEAVMLLLMADAMTMLGFATLIDIATRLRKPLPYWLAVLVGAGALILSGYIVPAMELTWSQGAWIFVPFVWSIFERIRELWTMPNASRIEKIRRRTLVFDRLYVGVHMLWLSTAIVLLVLISGGSAFDLLSDTRSWVTVGIAFYAVATFNCVRVHTARFAEQPSSLLPWFDKGDATCLDPL